MEIKEMTIEQLEERKAAIAVELDAPEADLDALESEARAIKEEIEARKDEEAKKAEIRAAVAAGAGQVTEKFEEKESKKMTVEEIRSMPNYVEAYANYIRTGRDEECRMILTETNPGSVVGGGPVPVPVIVDEIVRTAWDKNDILTRVRKTNFKGNLKVAFERSADAAVVHTEGTSAPSEESLVLGIVTMIPKNIKKYIRITDEAATMGGEAFLRYIYDELTYQIIKKLADDVVSDIAGAGTSHSGTAVGVPKVSASPAVGCVAKAMGYLSDEATDLCVAMNRLTFAEFKSAQYAAEYAVDVFEGLPVVFTNALPAYSAASANGVYAIVGDFKGAQVNYPEGEGVAIKYDDLSEAEADLIKIVGRQYAAHAVTAPGRFVNVTKPGT